MKYMEQCQFLGIEIIDNQHVELIDKGNNLIKILETKGSQDEVLKNYNDFIKVIENHFLTEEELFRTFDYKEAKRHIEMHRFFLEAILEPKKIFAESDVELSTYVINFLNQWAKNHITSFDLDFANEYKKFKKM